MTCKTQPSLRIDGSGKIRLALHHLPLISTSQHVSTHSTPKPEYSFTYYQSGQVLFHLWPKESEPEPFFHTAWLIACRAEPKCLAVLIRLCVMKSQRSETMEQFRFGISAPETFGKVY
ncbi:hypothetical protein NQ318_010460 [Aromia moschata]|uniref:Uncharacterized protein n=1 Tax=Aromia moschata TaxID=1265417 RepID=A0AAV8YCH1_9CUCU|nr:hypothetical protein NQ318_010460 [Aromia moschata]